MVVRRVGGEDRVCDRCKSITESYDNFSGLQDGSQETATRPSFSMVLAEASDNSQDSFFVASTWLDDIITYDPSPGSRAGKVDIGWHTISSQVDDDGSLSIERLVIPYATSEEASEDKTMTFSRSAGRPQNLSSVTLESQAIVAQNTSPDWEPTQPYAGRVRPAMIDDRLLRRWKDCCMRDHGGTCDQTFLSRQVQHLRFVDIVERCVVDAAPDMVTWTALSYCWGGPQLHSLQKKNLEEYRVAGSLIDTILSKGIVDAMAVTRRLGERYMWIDSLCIIQDDDKDKLESLSAMGTIYAHAVVTIVNAASEKVSMGMPGVSIPRRMQTVHQLKDFWLVESLDPVHPGWRSGGYLDGTTWNTRGWTFQEGLLSPRCLLITQDQVYWQYNTASWCEDSCWEVPADKGVYRHYSGSNIMRRLTDRTEKSCMALYSDILSAYSQRELGLESDRLSAVQAILDVARRDDEEGYFWGMPVGHLEMALTWKFQKPRNWRRECDAMFMGAGNDVQSAPFPSWSWVGWHGVTQMPSVNPLLGGRLGLKFYRITNGPGLEPLIEAPFVGPERYFSTKGYMKYEGINEDHIGYPRGLTHPIMDYGKQSIDLADIPQSVLSSAEAPSVLCFWTSTAVLDMKYEGWDGYHNCPLILLSHGEVSFYGVWDDDDTFKPDGAGKFIVVGTERARMERGGQVMVNLLLVDRDERGISHRSRGVTCTPESVWQSLENREWELVVLA